MNHYLGFLFFTALATSCATGSAVRSGAPAAAPQSDAERKAHPNATLLAAFGGGNFDYETQGAQLEGDGTALMMRLMAEGNSDAGFGGGLNLEVMATSDNLFDTFGIEPTEASAVDFFPYFLYQVRGSDKFRMPVRLGLWLRAFEVQGQLSGGGVSWDTFGARVSVEPELVLARAPGFEASVALDLSLGRGNTAVDVAAGSVADAEYDTDATLFAFEIGPRLRFKEFFFGVSFLHRAVSYDDSDTVGAVFFRGVDETASCFMVTLGARL